MCQDKTGRWFLTGVVAGGNGCADPSSPALYTRVSRFRNWIDEVISTRVHPEEPHTPEDVTHNELTHTHGEHAHGVGKGKYFHVHGESKDTQETNDINEIKRKHTHNSHTNEHVSTHAKSPHTHHVGDTNTQILA